MKMLPPTVPQGYVNCPSHDELVTALEMISHATAPSPNDGGHHEAAYSLAEGTLQKVRAWRAYRAAHPKDAP